MLKDYVSSFLTLIQSFTVFSSIRAPGAKTKFEGVPLFKSSKDQSTIGVAHDKDLDY